MPQTTPPAMPWKRPFTVPNEESSIVSEAPNQPTTKNGTDAPNTVVGIVSARMKTMRANDWRQRYHAIDTKMARRVAHPKGCQCAQNDRALPFVVSTECRSNFTAERPSFSFFASNFLNNSETPCSESISTNVAQAASCVS